MNATLTELKLDQWQMAEDERDQVDLRPPTNPPLQLLPPTDASELWDAIDRLDNTVVNNTVKVSLHTFVRDVQHECAFRTETGN